ncbi:MAG: Fe-S cluster assembly protein SufD [Planctomycetota bacterium]
MSTDKTALPTDAPAEKVATPTALAADASKVHLEAAHAFAKDASGPEWLKDLRERAVRVFEKKGFPGKREESFRYTNMRAATNGKFALGTGDEAAAKVFVDAYAFEGVAATVVMVDGRFSKDLSTIGDLPAGVVVGDLFDMGQNEPVVQKELARQADVETNPFVALNTAFLGGGAFVHVPSKTTIDKPIHVLSINTGNSPTDEEAVVYPRLLVIAGDRAEFSLVETFVGPEETAYLTNAVTEIVAGADCQIDHNKLNAEGRDGLHVATMEVDIGKSTVFVDHNSTIGSRLTRNDLNVHLNGERADATLSGVSILTGKQHVDNHTLLDHQEPDCPSFELYKHVLDDEASGIFKGQIFVAQKAQRTDSKQSSRSLLLSDDAAMQSQPALEIYADDVKCTHGSTTGPLDEEAVFYLNSRGVSGDMAKRLLTYAFAADVTRRIKVEAVRQRVEDYMAKQHGLPTDFRIQDLADATEDVVF